jgi:hypothetical protein
MCYFQFTYEWCPDILPVRDDLKGIANTRQVILDHCSDNNIDCCIMMDDDMQFYVRKEPGDWHLRYCDEEEIGDMLDLLEHWILVDGFAHAGISPRQGNNNESELYILGSRMCNFYAHNVKILEHYQLRWDDMQVMEDFNMTLKLLTLGYPNIVSFHYAWGQGSSNAPGGCSSYRTLEVQEHQANQLAEKFPRFVSTVKKKNKTGWEGMEERVDVYVQWKQALKCSGVPFELPDPLRIC